MFFFLFQVSLHRRNTERAKIESKNFKKMNQKSNTPDYSQEIECR